MKKKVSFFLNLYLKKNLLRLLKKVEKKKTGRLSYAYTMEIKVC